MNIYEYPRRFTIFFFVLILFDVVPCMAASFTAGLFQRESGEISTGKFFLKDHRYRMDITEDGEPISILVDQENGKTRVLVPSEKAYLEIANNSMQSLMKNPFEAYKHMAGKYGVRSGGQESMQGLACEKQVISMDGKEVMTAWITTKYGFPVKIINPLNHYLAELRNIEEKSLPDKFFAVPADFKKVEHMPIPVPAWAQDIPSAPLLKPPFSRQLYATETLRIQPVKGYFVRLEMAVSGDEPCQVTAVGFKNGRPVRDPSYRTYMLSQKGQKIITTNKARPEEVDEIVVRVGKGKAVVRADFTEAPPEGVVLKKYHLRMNHGRQIDLNSEKASRLIIQDDPGDGTPSIGTIHVFETISEDAGNGVTAYQNKRVDTLSFQLADGASRMWTFSRDSKIGLLGIDVTKGAVNVRIEQPQRAGTVPPSWLEKQQDPGKESHAQPLSGQKETSHAKVIFILDASGSMWGQVNGKPKIAIAKEVMDDLVDHLPSSMEVGLMAYGHRRKGDCTDIELLVPLDKCDPSALKAKINALHPKGKTPLSAAVEQAARKLRYSEERATVVLISDGLETCNADPCKLAERLAMTGVDFTVHVIGFDLEEQEQARLRCLADKTGGLFLAASDAGGLRQALRKTVDKVRQPPPAIRENPGKAELKAPDSVPIASAFKVTWQGPDSRGDYVAISRKGSKDTEYEEYAFTRSGNPVHITAPAETGSYELRYIHAHSGRVIGRRPVMLVPVPAEVSAPAQIAVATEFEVQWKGPAHADDMITLARPGQAPSSYLAIAYAHDGSPAKLRAPAEPGTYEVRYLLANGAKLLARAPVTVKDVTAVLKAPASVKAGSRFKVQWQGPANPDDMIMLATPEQDVTSYVAITCISRGNPVTFTAPQKPGTYELRYILFQGPRLLARLPIAINAP